MHPAVAQRNVTIPKKIFGIDAPMFLFIAVAGVAMIVFHPAFRGKR
jgi:hypothetical protein